MSNIGNYVREVTVTFKVVVTGEMDDFNTNNADELDAEIAALIANDISSAFVGGEAIVSTRRNVGASRFYFPGETVPPMGQVPIVTTLAELSEIL